MKPNSSREPSTAPDLGTYRGLLYGAAALLAVACSPPVDTEGRAGEWLVDLGSVQCDAHPVVSFPSDRNWMLFWIEHFQPDSGMGFPLVSPAMLEVDSRRLVLPAGPADRMDGPSFAPSSLCWDDAGQGVFVSSERLRADADRHWYRAVGVLSPARAARLQAFQSVSVKRFQDYRRAWTKGSWWGSGPIPAAVGSPYPLVPGYCELNCPKTAVYASQGLSGSEDAIVSMFDEYGL